MNNLSAWERGYQHGAYRTLQSFGLFLLSSIVLTGLAAAIIAAHTWSPKVVQVYGELLNNTTFQIISASTLTLLAGFFIARAYYGGKKEMPQSQSDAAWLDLEEEYLPGGLPVDQTPNEL